MAKTALNHCLVMIKYEKDISKTEILDLHVSRASTGHVATRKVFGKISILSQNFIAY